MTDRELKKLSRLELLELLLDISKENSELEEKVKKLSSENEAAKSIENLSVTTKQAGDILEYANRLVGMLTNEPCPVSQSDNSSDNVVQNSADKSKKHTDRDLYVRLMNFYIKNADALEFLSDELKDDVRKRISEIAECKKRNN